MTMTCGVSQSHFVHSHFHFKYYTMEDSIFWFNDKEALSVQSDTICQDLYNDFFSKLSGYEDSFDFQVDVGPFEEIKDKFKIKWYAAYGAALIYWKKNSRDTMLVVAGLDGWNYHVHAWVGGRQPTARADVANPFTRHFGTVPTEKMQEILNGFSKMLQETHSNRNDQKNHKTPAFAAATLWHYLQKEGFSAAPVRARDNQGGTTDVGNHTGCIPRNTSFPLVLTSVKVMLNIVFGVHSNTLCLFGKAVALYYLQYLRKAVSGLKTYIPRKIDRAFAVMREMETWVNRIDDSNFQEWIVDRIEKQQSLLTNVKPPIPDDGGKLVYHTVEETLASLKAPSFPSVPDHEGGHTDQQAKLSRAVAQAQKNLNWSDMNSPSVAKGEQDIWLVLAKLNVQFWDMAMELSKPESHQNINSLLQMVQEHSKATSLALEIAANSTLVVSVDLRSCELLAIWIACCWAHRSAIEHHPVYSEYSAALDPSDLKHLVLRERKAIDALCAVQAFLKRHRSRSHVPFRDHSATLRLAFDVTSNSELLLDRYRIECDTANRQIELRYENICETQRKLRELDGQLSIAKRELQAAENATSRSEQTNYRWEDSYYSMTKVYNAEHHRIREHEQACRSKVQSLQAKISNLENKPADLFFPLPEERHTSLQWLFFIFMPAEFVDLVALIHLGQSKLWKVAPNVAFPPLDLVHWYSSHTSTRDPTSQVPTFGLGSHANHVSSLQTPGIRSYGRRTGVFYPDSYTASPSWRGKDPFSTRSEEDTVKLFTEQLPPVENASLMQNYLPMLPDSERGNMGISKKNKKPSWLTHEEMSVFSSLRAFPRIQFRQLLAALTDGLLPFENLCVNVLIKQLLYHFGDLSWKKDLNDFNGMDLIAEQMERHKIILQESPKNIDRLLIFGSICCFLGQYSDRLLDLANQFSQIAQNFASEVTKEAVNIEQISPQLQWKQARFYGYSLLCYSVGDCNTLIHLRILELLILYRNKVEFASEIKESSSLETPIKQMMASRAEGIIECVRENTEYLTHCLQRVIDDVPDSLEWTNVQFGSSLETGCFNAVSNHLYSINVLNGTILVDGVPPGLLPSSITTNPLYQRTFGERNFEVVVLTTGRYRSIRRIDSRYLYEFTSDDSGTLFILEWDMSCEGQPEKLLLLPRESMDFPTIFCQGFSHWYSLSNDCLLLRDPFYRSRRVEYVVTKTETREVPYSLQTMPAAEILSAKNSLGGKLFMGETSVSKVLHRIEKSAYIHLVQDAKRKALRFSLPRYKLEFELTKDGVRSLTFKDFCLEDSQVLDNTLWGVKSYLILAHKDGRKIVLIPAGPITEEGDITIPSNWNAQTSYHVYDIHGRFEHLIAREPLGRLQLAGLYAASACHLSEGRSGKTGMFLATKLVRQCWANEPLSDSFHAKLREISQLSNLCCSLRLMCSFLWNCSNSLRFLHTSEALPRDHYLETDLLAVDEYRLNRYAPRLLPAEESDLLANGASNYETAQLKAKVSGTRKFIQNIEDTLRQKCLRANGEAAPKGRFPLPVPAEASGIEKNMHDDLEKSWKSYCSLRDHRVEFDVSLCSEFLQKTSKRRQSLEESLLLRLESTTSATEKLAKLAGRVPAVSSLDLLCMVDDLSRIFQFNPSMKDSEEVTELRLKIIDWMCLCVLENKLTRMLNKHDSQHEVLEDLRCRRHWDPLKFPKWLAFEVEQRLQIRPYQFAIVEQLLEKPGSAIQLNMGLGKTSVLVPMLVLELSKPSMPIVRVNLLASIFDVVANEYRGTLVASEQHTRLFTMPFNRDVPLEEKHAGLLTDEIQFCQACNGFFVVTPQHRNSVLLKQYDKEVFISGLKDVAFTDLIDESDAILDCR